MSLRQQPAARFQRSALTDDPWDGQLLGRMRALQERFDAALPDVRQREVLAPSGLLQWHPRLLLFAGTGAGLFPTHVEAGPIWFKASGSAHKAFRGHRWSHAISTRRSL